MPNSREERVWLSWLDGDAESVFYYREETEEVQVSLVEHPVDSYSHKFKYESSSLWNKERNEAKCSP